MHQRFFNLTDSSKENYINANYKELASFYMEVNNAGAKERMAKELLDLVYDNKEISLIVRNIKKDLKFYKFSSIVFSLLLLISVIINILFGLIQS